MNSGALLSNPRCKIYAISIPYDVIKAIEEAVPDNEKRQRRS